MKNIIILFYIVLISITQAFSQNIYRCYFKVGNGKGSIPKNDNKINANNTNANANANTNTNTNINNNINNNNIPINPSTTTPLNPNNSLFPNDIIPEGVNVVKVKPTPKPNKSNSQISKPVSPPPSPTPVQNKPQNPVKTSNNSAGSGVHCERHMVISEDENCTTIVNRYRVGSLAELIRLNNRLDCNSLSQGTKVCVKGSGGGNSFYEVGPGEDCKNVVSNTGLSRFAIPYLTYNSNNSYKNINSCDDVRPGDKIKWQQSTNFSGSQEIVRN